MRNLYAGQEAIVGTGYGTMDWFKIGKGVLQGCILPSYFTSVAQSGPTLCDPVDCSMPGFPVHHQLLKLTQAHVNQVGDAIQPSYLLSSPSPPPSIFPSIRVFSSESVLCIRWPKYWSFSFNVSSYNEDSGLISFRMDWLDLLAVDLGWTNAHSVAKPSHAATKHVHTVTKWHIQECSQPLTLNSPKAWKNDPNGIHLFYSIRRLSAEKLMLSDRGAGEDSWESLRRQEDQTSLS